MQLQLPKLDLTTSADLLPYLREQLPLQVKGVAGGFANMLETKDAGGAGSSSAAGRVAGGRGRHTVVTSNWLTPRSTPMSNIGVPSGPPYLFTISGETTGWPILVASVGDPRS